MSLHCPRDLTLRYVVCYIIWVSVLFALIFFEGFSPFHIINELQTTMTLYLTHLWVDIFSIQVSIIGEKIIFEHGFKLLILNECNGMTPILLFTAGVLSYPTKYQFKIEWILGGYIILVIINMMRIYFITIWLLDNPESFHFMHNFIARYIVGAFTLLLFYLFTRNAKVVNL